MTELTENNVKTSPVERLLALDALRLGASLVVFCQHFFIMFNLAPPRWISSGLFDAKGAVTLFFVLSGYVLSISLSRSAPSFISYLKFGVRRALRIYPVYWVALLISFVTLMWIRADPGFIPLKEMNASFLNLTDGGIHGIQWLLQTTLILPGMKSDFALPPVWTLMTEAKMAIIFPVLVWLLYRSSWTAAGIMLSCLVFGSSWLGEHVVGTAALVGQFAIGALLFRTPASVWHRFNNRSWLLVLAGSCLMYTCVSLRYTLPSPWISYYICAFGSAGLIACAVHWKPMKSRLDNLQSIIRYDLSYGIYIIHYPIMLGLRKLWLDDVLPIHPILLFIVSFALTATVSLVLFHAVEMPAVNLGRRLTRAPGNRQKPVA